MGSSHTFGNRQFLHVSGNASLAAMLGARRASVTKRLRPLQEAGLIHSSRWLITILDAAGLEARSCECYAVVRDWCEELLNG